MQVSRAVLLLSFNRSEDRVFHDDWHNMRCIRYTYTIYSIHYVVGIYTNMSNVWNRQCVLLFFYFIRSSTGFGHSGCRRRVLFVDVLTFNRRHNVFIPIFFYYNSCFLFHLITSNDSYCFMKIIFHNYIVSKLSYSYQSFCHNVNEKIISITFNICLII